MEYYCLQCQKIVLTILMMFQHPHLGMKSAYVCRECGGMVTLKEDGKQSATT